MANDVRTRPTTPGVPPERPRRTWPDRIAAILPGAFLAVVFGFFFITKTSEAWTATKSVRAMLVIGGIVVGWVVLAWLLRRFVRWVWIRAAILSAIAVAIAVVLIRPYYVDVRDDTKLVKGPVQDAFAGGATCARRYCAHSDGTRARQHGPTPRYRPLGERRGRPHPPGRRVLRGAVLELRHRRQPGPDRLRPRGREPDQAREGPSWAVSGATSAPTPTTPCRRGTSRGRAGPCSCGAGPLPCRSPTPRRLRRD